MPAPDELYPPAQYGWGWIALAIGILLLLAAAAWLLIVLTRPKRSIHLAGETTFTPPAAAFLDQLRGEYLADVQHIEDAYRSGNISPRQANLELSRSVRAFVNEYSGLEAPVLSLDDLVTRGVDPALIDAIRRHYYPSIFQRGPAIDPIYGAEAARKVVTTWH
ncbi:hypothetical protein FVO59_05990 [Microbacterium esteraromaticum]|uniref:Uncharacterized protein n=1 Tax=Microbacterium esteraromaticum TaxID=57043 RepID=A0A7D8AEH1_9MICO|nr:hypothetical protein [Microbacterium esteraromaticum]QMU96823.1 hypothetical protein FVO59_05990 [Microbacterium esteraromaticum]